MGRLTFINIRIEHLQRIARIYSRDTVMSMPPFEAAGA